MERKKKLKVSKHSYYSDMEDQKYWRLEGDGIVDDYEDWGFDRKTALRIVKALKVLEIVESGINEETIARLIILTSKDKHEIIKGAQEAVMRLSKISSPEYAQSRLVSTKTPLERP